MEDFYHQRIKEIERYVIERVESAFNGRKFVYEVVSREEESIAATLACYAEGRIFVSEVVPREFRYPIAVHELIECSLKSRGVEQEIAHVCAMQSELEAMLRLPRETQRRYLLWKRALWEEVGQNKLPSVGVKRIRAILKMHDALLERVEEGITKEDIAELIKPVREAYLEPEVWDI